MTEKEAKAVYNSKRWKDPVNGKRIQILKRDHYECQDCIARIAKARRDGVRLYGSDANIRVASEVHHIKELKDYPDLAFDDDNLISLCTECHNIRHGRYPKHFLRSKKRLTEEKW